MELEADFQETINCKQLYLEYYFIPCVAKGMLVGADAVWQRGSTEFFAVRVCFYLLETQQMKIVIIHLVHFHLENGFPYPPPSL